MEIFNPLQLFALSTYFISLECQSVYFTKNNDSIILDEDVELDGSNEEIEIIDLENELSSTTNANYRRYAVTKPINVVGKAVDQQENDVDFDYSYDEDTRVIARDGDNAENQVDHTTLGPTNEDPTNAEPNNMDPTDVNMDPTEAEPVNMDPTDAEEITVQPEGDEATAAEEQESSEKSPDKQTGNATSEDGQTDGQNKTKSPKETAEYEYYSDETTTTTTAAPRLNETEEIDEDKYIDRRDEQWYLDFRDRHNLPEPYQLPQSKKLPELEELVRFCRCPRVYWPVCSESGLTYMNFCIMTCLHQTLKRYGPCIVYRRSRRSYTVKISLT